jgi:hypothetical protein
MRRWEYCKNESDNACLPHFQTPSIVSYKDGAVKCGAEAVEDLHESQGNDVAYWFKVMVYSTKSNRSEV